MKVRKLGSEESFSANSDFELKLVPIWSFVGGTPFCELFGTSSEVTSEPDGVIWSRKIFEVIPKLPSPESLFQTYGYVPSLIAVVSGVVHEPEAATQFGGRAVIPITVLFGLLSYTLRLTTR